MNGIDAEELLVKMHFEPLEWQLPSGKIVTMTIAEAARNCKITKEELLAAARTLIPGLEAEQEEE